MRNALFIHRSPSVKSNIQYRINGATAAMERGHSRFVGRYRNFGKISFNALAKLTTSSSVLYR